MGDYGSHPYGCMIKYLKKNHPARQKIASLRLGFKSVPCCGIGSGWFGCSPQPAALQLEYDSDRGGCEVVVELIPPLWGVVVESIPPLWEVEGDSASEGGQKGPRSGHSTFVIPAEWQGSR